MMFVLLYIITGFIMAKHKWFPETGQIETTNKYPLSVIIDSTRYNEVGKEIKSVYRLSGRQEGPWQGTDGWMGYIFHRPGVAFEAIIHPAHDTITIIKKKQISLRRISSRLHVLRGFEGGWKYVIWAIFYDLAALALIVFSLTGIFIWYRNRKPLRLGWFIIVPVIILSIVLYVYLM